MPSYRIFFLNEEGRVDGREGFEAANDAEAERVCAAVVAACSDVPGGFMLWRGARQLLSTDSPKSRACQAAPVVDADTQRKVLDLEKSILQGRWRISQSRTLLRAMKSLRDQIEPPRGELDDWAAFACAAADADKASLQLLQGGELQLVGVSGFDQQFSDFFGVVTHDEQCCCARVFRQRQQIVVPDVQESMLFGGRELMKALERAGVRSVISSPLLASDGRLIGVISTHKSEIWSRAENDSERHRQMADQVAAMVAQASLADARPGGGR